MPSSKPYTFLPDGVTFTSSSLTAQRLIYAPLCGIDGDSVKSAITPYLAGDIKIDKNRYLTKPASREDLRAPVRNFFVYVNGKGFRAIAAKAPGDSSSVEIGQIWHQLTRTDKGFGLALSALSFVPVSGEKFELTRFCVRNVSAEDVTLTPTAVIPVFGRSLANKHDHEHVTALLNRVTQVPEGVMVAPTMRFNEEGHKVGHDVYAVLGVAGDGALPTGSFPTADDFYGDEGDADCPRAVEFNETPRVLSEAACHGREAAGALRFADVTLKPGEARDFIVGIGVAASHDEAVRAFRSFDTNAKFDAALRANKDFWQAKTSSILFDNGDADFSAWMRWVTLQPVLRRIFGCSFLPDHDYGKGGKGWRDIWQDLLSLILIEPGLVRENLLNNFAGVRVDGSNATIIGQRPGEFIADRNAITRVWMDHGVWPFLTIQLYMDQTGDDEFIFEKMPYFCDPQMHRTFEKNADWTSSYGNAHKDKKGHVYQGTVLEHVLIQHLVPFFNVGEHNIIRLESADWNDGLDMAFKRGESVAFMSFYSGNLLSIAKMLERLVEAGKAVKVTVAKELLILLDTLGKPVDYNDAAAKRGRLFEEYFTAVQPELSGDVVEIEALKIAEDLRRKSEWITAHIRQHEKVSATVGGAKFAWFNGYYDNNGARVEGSKEDHVRMTLTGQVFPLMHGVATHAEVAETHKAVERFLKDTALGGYRLNTDFGVRHYLALGRAFGFAFGTKENGAVFSHMVVMYAYALYVRGFAREGHEVLRSLYTMSRHADRAKIYPGVPEYFDGTGRGMYHFLTGSASWYVLTLLTQAYGVRGEAGDLVLAPQLVAEEFDAQGQARVLLQFAGKNLSVVYINPQRLEAGQYKVASVDVAGRVVDIKPAVSGGIKIARKMIIAGSQDVEVRATLARLTL
ncbi:MAG: cellobiose phosphorylase [Candidatus Omnitrophica bacterium]|nr:cellobiose phosphorylase [Candidatus Omnitrophota bacterium]